MQILLRDDRRELPLTAITISTTMPAIELLRSPHGPAVTLAVDGGRLLDACDDARAPVAFSCRSASCGTCRVEVLTGAELLEPPGPDELEVLAIFAAAPRERLACQAVVRSGAGLIRLGPVED
ncbi:MAG: 2Fe-2S iron-sulfur cluster-binding protein [Byssovorax sp.]